MLNEDDIDLEEVTRARGCAGGLGHGDSNEHGGFSRLVERCDGDSGGQTAVLWELGSAQGEPPAWTGGARTGTEEAGIGEWETP